MIRSCLCRNNVPNARPDRGKRPIPRSCANEWLYTAVMHILHRSVLRVQMPPHLFARTSGISGAAFITFKVLGKCLCANERLDQSYILADVAIYTSGDTVMHVTNQRCQMLVPTMRSNRSSDNAIIDHMFMKSSKCVVICRRES